MGKILIVDDEAHVIRLLRDYLTSKNYEVYTATNGLEAIEKVKEVMPHIVFLDIIMPGLGGIETLREIKKINSKIWVARFSGLSPRTTNRLEKSSLPTTMLTSGMIRSPTTESTILPKAAPMMTPTARSIALPLTANSLNSCNMPMLFPFPVK